MSESNTPSGGISLFGLLGIVFIILKLCDKIAWSWWWVTCPFWAPPAVLLLVGAVMYCYGAATLNNRLKRSGISCEQIKQLKSKMKEPIKSKWQQRMEEIQKKQRANVS